VRIQTPSATSVVLVMMCLSSPRLRHEIQEGHAFLFKGEALAAVEGSSSRQELGAALRAAEQATPGAWLSEHTTAAGLRAKEASSCGLEH